MGAVTKFLRDLDPSKDLDSQLKEMLNILVELAKAKLSGFEEEMNKSWKESNDENLAPGVTKDFQNAQMHVITSTDTSPIQTSISKIVDSSFALGATPGAKTVSDFIKTLVQVGLDTVLGTGAAEENESKQYIIYPDGNYLCRCDIWYWRYSIVSKGFQQRLQHVLVYRVQYGAVDITKVEPTALAHWFDKWGLKATGAQELLDQAQKIIDAAKPKPTVAGELALPMHSISSLRSSRAALIEQRGI